MAMAMSLFLGLFGAYWVVVDWLSLETSDLETLLETVCQCLNLPVLTGRGIGHQVHLEI